MLKISWNCVGYVDRSKVRTVCISPLTCTHQEILVFIFSCDRAALRTLLSVCLSVRKVNIAEVKPQFSCFQTVSPPWIHKCRLSDAHSLRELIRGAILFFEGHLSKFKVTWGKMPILTERFLTVTQVCIHRWLWNDAQSLTWYRRGTLFAFQCHLWKIKATRDKKITIFDSNSNFKFFIQ